MMYLINIQYIEIIIDCHPSKTIVNLGFASVDISRWQFPMLPSRAVNIYIMVIVQNVLQFL